MWRMTTWLVAGLRPPQGRCGSVQGPASQPVSIRPLPLRLVSQVTSREVSE